MSPLWLTWTVPLTLVAGFVLVGMILRLVRLNRSGEVASAPLLPTQDLRLEATGAMLLHGEGPRLTTTFAHLRFHLTQRLTGASVRMSPVLLRSSSSGLSVVRISLQGFRIDTPGEYTLTIEGLETDTRAEGHRLILARDQRAKAGLLVAVLVLSAVGALGGVVLSILAGVS